MPSDHPQYISTIQLAQYLGISRVAILKRIQKEDIDAVKIGRSYAIPEAYVRKNFPGFKPIAINISDGKEYVSVMQAAEMLGLSRFTISKRIQKGQLEAKKVGRHYVIEKRLIEHLQSEGEKSPYIPNEFLSIPEYAQVLGVSRIAIFKKVKKGMIKAKRIGRNYVIAREDIVSSEKNIKREKINYISVKELAKELGVSRITVFKKIQKGQIKAIKIGRSFAIKREELTAFLLKKEDRREYKKENS